MLLKSFCTELSVKFVNLVKITDRVCKIPYEFICSRKAILQNLKKK